MLLLEAIAVTPPYMYVNFGMILESIQEAHLSVEETSQANEESTSFLGGKPTPSAHTFATVPIEEESSETVFRERLPRIWRANPVTQYTHRLAIVEEDTTSLSSISSDDPKRFIHDGLTEEPSCIAVQESS